MAVEILSIGINPHLTVSSSIAVIQRQILDLSADRQTVTASRAIAKIQIIELKLKYQLEILMI